MKYTNKHPSYTYQKDSYYYFSRAVPFDLRDHYSTSRLVICLHTKSRYRAKLASKNITSKLDDYWLGLRHSFRDRLTNKEVPTEVIDQLGGWSFSSIGQSYGEGYNLKVLQKYIERIID